MRIISGEWGGRKIITPKGDSTRPTADRTRETLFNMLASRLGAFNDLAVADLFAGSGALGLEALSRGAGSCLFVEQDANAVKAIRTNIETFGARARCDIRASSAMALSQAKASLDLILLDPPYGTGAANVALDKMMRLGWIGAGTWIAVETGSTEDVEVKALSAKTERKVGKAKLTLLRLAEQSP